MKDIILKLLKGETLTEEEKTLLQNFDLDKMTNDAAAAARRKAESERDEAKKLLGELQKQLDETKAAGEGQKTKSLTELQKLQAQVDALVKANAEKDAKIAADTREKTIDSIQAKAGIKFIDNVDAQLMKRLFAGVFDGLADLTDEAAVTERVKAFTTANKGLIVDTSGNGSGRSAQPAGSMTSTGNPYSAKSFNLTKQAELERTNPAEAARLQAAADA